MGLPCCGGKAGGADSTPKDGSIGATFQEMKVEKFDAFFAKVTETLDAAEELRAGVIDSKATVFDLTAQEYLKTPSLGNALRAFMTSAAIDLKDPSKLKPTFSAEDGISLDTETLLELSADNKEIFENLKLYIMTCKTLPEKVPEIGEKFKELMTEGTELGKSATTDFKDAGLGMKDTMMAAKNLASNTKALANASQSFASAFPPSLPAEAATDVADVISKAPEILKNIKADVDKCKEVLKDNEKPSASEITKGKVFEGLEVKAQTEVDEEEKKTGNKGMLKMRKENKSKGPGKSGASKPAASAGEEAKTADAPEAKEEAGAAGEEAKPAEAPTAAASAGEVDVKKEDMGTRV